MLRRCVSAAAVLFVLVGFVAAGSYQGLITKYDKEKGEVTFKVKTKGEKKLGDEKTMKVGKTVKIMKAKGKGKDAEEATDKDISEAIENAKGKVKGVMAKIETDGEGDKEMVTSVTILAKKSK